MITFITIIFEHKNVKLLLVFTFVLMMSGSLNFVFAQESSEMINTFDALNAFLINIADATPRIIGAIILMVIGIIVGKVIGKAVESKTFAILQRNLKHLPQDYLDESKDTKRIKPSQAIGGTVRWFVYLFFIISAVNVLEFKELAEPLGTIWLWFPNILAAMFVIIIGMILSNYISKWVDTEFPQNGSAKYVRIGSKVLIFGVILTIALTQIGIGQTILPIVVAALSIGIAVSIGVSLRNILPSLFSSSHRTYLKEGQKVKIGNSVGTVSKVDLMSVLLINDKNEKIIIPIKELSENTITIMEDKNSA